MSDPLDHAFRAKNGMEKIEFGSAKTLTGSGRRANGTMIFNQEKTILQLRPFGHVALAVADFGETPDLVAQRFVGIDQNGIAASHRPFAGNDNRIERRVTAGISDRVDELHGNLGMRVGKPQMPFVRQRPDLGRPSYAGRPLRGLDQALSGQRQNLHPGGFVRHTGSFGQVGDALRAVPFDRRENPAICLVIQVHP